MKEIRKIINEKITNNYQKYLEFAINIKGKSKENEYDILNECLLYLLKNTDEKLLKINEYFDFYIIKMIQNSFYSATSGYQVKYNRVFNSKNVCIEDYKMNEEKNEYDFPDELYDKIEIRMQKLDLFEKEVFTFYNSKKTSFRKMAKELQIPESSLYKAYVRAIDKLKVD